MGIMVDGVWHADEGSFAGSDGRFHRAVSPLRSWVTADGRAGPSGRDGYRAEVGRYHLYIAEGCPWAHRTWIYRVVKELEGAVSMSSVTPRRSDQGWIFDAGSESYRDHLFGSRSLHELYTRGAPEYNGRVTVPILWDKATDTIVSNESSEIIRMLNGAFREVSGNDLELYPNAQREEIDAINERVFSGFNNGVYRAGFASTQEAYEEAFDDVFATLDFLEERLETRRYRCGSEITEADWRLFPTLARFDVAYVGAFRCNLRRIVDYPNLWGYARDLYQHPGVAPTVTLGVYKQGYYSISAERNPLGLVPKGPAIDFSTPHGREALA